MNRVSLFSVASMLRRPWALAAVLCTLLGWSVVAAAGVSARFDRNQVYEGETVTLTVESEGLGGPSPDLSVLDADFDVLGTSSGSRIQIVNGRQSAMRSWQVTLAPKRLGTIEVAPIVVGDEQSAPLVLTVSETPQGASGGPGDDVFLELSVGGTADGADAPVYVQQQVPLTVRLYTALPLRVGELSEPRPDGAVLERLGEDVLYDASRHGRDYRVIERRFSLSPERSGELRVPPVTFTGELRATGRGARFGSDRLAQLFRDPVFDRFDAGLFDRGETVRARSRALTLEVLPQPDGFTGRHWLPATALAIEDSWERDPPQLAAGEPAERVLTVTATGLSGSQIPEIQVPAPNTVRVYTESADAETRTDGKRLFGVSRQRVTVIPTAGGTLAFPEVRLRWWDVSAGQERVAVVPARRVVAAGVVDVAPPPLDRSQAAQEGGRAGDAADPPEDTAGAPSELSERIDDTRRPALWLLLAAMALVGSRFFWRRRGRLTAWWRVVAARIGVGDAHRPRAIGSETSRRNVPVARSGVQGRREDPFKTLRAACARHDARAAAVALLAVARRAYGPTAPTSLGGIAARFAATDSPAAERAAESVRALEASLYGPDAGDWDAATLVEAVPAVLAEARPRPSGAAVAPEPLAPLYPERS